MRGRTSINAFNGGELSRRMQGRSDLPGIYDRAVAAMLNYVPTIEGPAVKRPGFRYVKAAAATATWLTPFIFNTRQAYVLEWAEQSIRFYTNDGQISIEGAPYVVNVPYTAAEAPRVSTHQSYDRLYMAHGAHAPAMLDRVSAERFAYAAMPLVNGPYKDWNIDKTKLLTWSGSGLVGGEATITCSAEIFDAGDVGAPFIFEAEDFSDIAAWEPSVLATGVGIGTLRRSDGKVYSCQGKKGGGSARAYTGTITPTHTQGDEWDGSGDIVFGTENDVGGVLWRYEYDRFGAGVITEVVDFKTVKVRVTRRLPQTGPTYKWASGCFSTKEGWPHLVTVWGGRLIFFKDNQVIGSVVGDYFNFSPITDGGLYAPDMAFRLTLGIKDPPQWVHADKEYLLAGCAREEIVVGVVNRASGLSKDNLMAQAQSSYGSADVWPVSIGTAILFVQRGGRKIREAQYAYTEERFAGANINVFARHVTKSGVKWLAFAQEPEEMLWGGRQDGALIAHAHSPEQETKGFARAELGAGTAIAGVAIPSTDGTRDELWILAELDGNRAVLQQTPFWDEDAGEDKARGVFVDWAVSYEGAPKQAFTAGLEHLEGKTVKILADGAVVPDRVVTGGSIFLSNPASIVQIGIGYEARLRLLRPEIRGAPTVQGKRARMVRLLTRLIDSGPMRIFSRGESDPLFDRPKSAGNGEAPPLFNGDTRDLPSGDGSDQDVIAEIVSADPLPSIVSLAIATYEIEELSR